MMLDCAFLASFEKALMFSGSEEGEGIKLKTFFALDFPFPFILSQKKKKQINFERIKSTSLPEEAETRTKSDWQVIAN